MKMKQIDLKQYQFSIIDKKILIIFEYSQQFRLILIRDDLIVNDYRLLFEQIWKDATDIRHQWLTEVSIELKNYIQKIFEKIPDFGIENR